MRRVTYRRSPSRKNGIIKRFLEVRVGASPQGGVHIKADGDMVTMAWRDPQGDPKMLRVPLAELPG